MKYPGDSISNRGDDPKQGDCIKQRKFPHPFEFAEIGYGPMLRKVSMNIMVRIEPSTGVAAWCSVLAISGPLEAIAMYENQTIK